MGIGIGLGGRVLVLGQAAAGWLAHRNYSTLPALQASGASGVGLVSIVIPARNEAERLSPLLESLHQLRYAEREILVVNDGSEDNTAALSEAHGVRVVPVDGPPPGWTGKCFACWMGAQQAVGEWILFTDADTVHGQDSLGLALAAAQSHNAGLVSLLARQRCDTFWEKLLLPYAFALYFVGAVRANKPGGPSVANGQYMLFRRSVYEATGGHAEVRGSIIEDVALARVVRAAGERVILARGETHLKVRMYDDLPSLWEGFSKNATRFVLAAPLTGALTVMGSIAWGMAVPRALRERSLSNRLLLLMVPFLALVEWERRFEVSPAYAALHPMAAAAFQMLALDSIRRTLPGRTRWRGRSY